MNTEYDKFKFFFLNKTVQYTHFLIKHYNKFNNEQWEGWWPKRVSKMIS